MSIILNSDQQAALDKFKEFLDHDSNENYDIFILKGYAGTGKTTLVKVMVEYASCGHECKLMAPTGRAAKVLAQKTEHVANTIHSTIYCGMNIDLETGKMSFGLDLNEDSLYTVYFVDEASMVSDMPSDNELFHFGTGYLMKDLLQFCSPRKIVFVGDAAQLPPVGQNTSPSLDAELLASRYNVKVMTAELTQVVRQDNKGLIYANASAIREALDAGCFTRFVIEEGDDVRRSTDLFADYAACVGGKADDESIIITYTNAATLDYNRKVRQMLFPQSGERLQVDDMLIVVRNHYSSGLCVLYNGTFVKVVSCDPDCMVEYHKVSFKTKKRYGEKEVETKHVTLGFRKLTVEKEDGTPYECLLLDSMLDDDDGAIDYDMNQALLVDFKNRHKGLSDADLRKKIEYDPYFNALVCKYGYAVTCHKAQGGEWDNVFVDMGDYRHGVQSGFYRWAYTAITRSSHKLWVSDAPHLDILSEMGVMPIEQGGNMVFHVPDGADFMDCRYDRLQRLCQEAGITCADDRTKANQHKVCFADSDGNGCVMLLWYGKQGYTGKDQMQKCASLPFAVKVKKICVQSLMVDGDPFATTCERDARLHVFVKDVAQRVGLYILNLQHLPYVDRYYLTDGENYQVVSFHYNGKGYYTSCRLHSSVGASDKVLEDFRTVVDAEKGPK